MLGQLRIFCRMAVRGVLSFYIVGKIVGIQRRFLNGRKVSVRGSKIGLFIPADLPTGSGNADSCSRDAC